jgi:CheY-like chemotaxis protein
MNKAEFSILIVDDDDEDILLAENRLWGHGLLRVADATLYQAKRRGRNWAVSAESAAPADLVASATTAAEASPSEGAS